MSEMLRSIFSGTKILVNGQWVTDKALVVEGRTIKGIIPEEMISHHFPAKHQHFPDHYLCAGFIDLHVHGAKGKDVMDGTVEALHVISQTLAQEGVTGFLATTMTAPVADIDRALGAISTVMSAPQAAAILGVHLEGPYLARSKMGAQNSEALQAPDLSQVMAWQKATNQAIKLVTVAPELPGALEFIRGLHNQNIIAAIGHTDATYAQTLAGIEAGCTHATHLFNAMRGITQREPGAVGAILLSEKVTAELIVDRWHLHPAIVELTLRLKGKEKLILVTDAMRAKCLGDGRYDLGGQWVDVEGGKATLADNPAILAGSTLKMSEAIANVVAFTHCTLPEAIAMATINPAEVLGITQHKGSIEVGKDADLTILDPALVVKYTMREGDEIWRA